MVFSSTSTTPNPSPASSSTTITALSTTNNNSNAPPANQSSRGGMTPRLPSSHSTSQLNKNKNSCVTGGGGEKHMLLTRSQVISYLKENPEFLKNYVVNHVEKEQIDSWLSCKRSSCLDSFDPISTGRRRSKSPYRNLSPSGVQPIHPSSRHRKVIGTPPLMNKEGRKILRKLLMKMQQAFSASESVDIEDILNELVALISKNIRCDIANLYLVRDDDSETGNGNAIKSKHSNRPTTNNPSTVAAVETSIEVQSGTKQSVFRFSNNGNRTSHQQKAKCLSFEVKVGGTMVGFCAKTRKIVRDCTSTTSSDYPLGVSGLRGDYCVMIHPIEHPDTHELIGVVELIRRGKWNHFTDEENETLAFFLTWAQISMSLASTNSDFCRQKNLNAFLLQIVRSIFMNIISIDELIIKIMNYASKLVNADRASLFLVDCKTNQMYAKIFDVSPTVPSEKENAGGDDQNEETNSNTSSPSSSSFVKDCHEIRFPVGTGIAGYVARTGETLNVSSAYDDPRFNMSVDEMTGYSTRNVLCMPISIRDQVIGVVQMINKKNGDFDKSDEEAFEVFAVYCGLALHHAKLYDNIRRSEQKHKVALEVLSYHNGSSAAEVEDIMKEVCPTEAPFIADFDFYALNMDDNEKIQNSLFMFIDLFGLDRFDYETVVRFLITVKKNYRQVSYHNWTHGFHVANSIYSILKAAPFIFNPLESLSMYVSAICHDLDHRGFNNKFMIDIGSPLAAIYSTSTMEHHHFNMTVNILQQEHHNIFNKLSSEEYRQVLGNIKHCILATDLALFFPNKGHLTNILKDNSFNWNLSQHRMLAQSLTMTGSDLCSASKPWVSQEATANVIYEEFYEQGDVEKNLGWTPIPLFDRDHEDDMESMQVGFISGICLPCYDLLVNLIPECLPMKIRCEENLNLWKAKSVQKKLEKEEGPRGTSTTEKVESEDSAKLAESGSPVADSDGNVEDLCVTESEPSSSSDPSLTNSSTSDITKIEKMNQSETVEKCLQNKCSDDHSSHIESSTKSSFLEDPEDDDFTTDIINGEDISIIISDENSKNNPPTAKEDEQLENHEKNSNVLSTKIDDTKSNIIYSKTSDESSCSKNRMISSAPLKSKPCMKPSNASDKSSTDTVDGIENADESVVFDDCSSASKVRQIRDDEVKPENDDDDEQNIEKDNNADSSEDVLNQNESADQEEEMGESLTPTCEDT